MQKKYNQSLLSSVERQRLCIVHLQQTTAAAKCKWTPCPVALVNAQNAQWPPVILLAFYRRLQAGIYNPFITSHTQTYTTQMHAYTNHT